LSERKRTFVGFGFGAIQAGLFLYEAQNSEAFDRMVVSEVLPQVVKDVRAAGGYCRVNIARADRVEAAAVGPIEILDPSVEDDRRALIEAIAEAEEIATAVPSVSSYRSSSSGSIHRLLARGLLEKSRRRGPRAVVYAAENHNQAAEILQEQTWEEIPLASRASAADRVRFLNTVIGKMSGTVADSREIEEAGLATVTETDARAFLVEEFNRILISRIDFGPGAQTFRRGIAVFSEKDNLLPFEEAKLYGHNAAHALAAYLARLKGVVRIAELRRSPALMAFLRDAFVDESGAALIAKHQGVDPLFTLEGFRRHADDLLQRMVNPFLRDTAERVGRDPRRKLGWDDRLIGTIRLALERGVRPWRYCVGAAAALACLHPGLSQEHSPCLAPLLDACWGSAAKEAPERRAVVVELDKAWPVFREWLDAPSIHSAPTAPATAPYFR
jgi:mannitol-1-phosphate 5-dehydrogenase